jgi:hypothetical protein
MPIAKSASCQLQCQNFGVRSRVVVSFAAIFCFGDRPSCSVNNHRSNRYVSSSSSRLRQRHGSFHPLSMSQVFRMVEVRMKVHGRSNG